MESGWNNGSFPPGWSSLHSHVPYLLPYLEQGALAGRYEFVRQEKLSRAHIGVADRYFLRGDTAIADAPA